MGGEVIGSSLRSSLIAGFQPADKHGSSSSPPRHMGAFSPLYNPRPTSGRPPPASLALPPTHKKGVRSMH